MKVEDTRFDSYTLRQKTNMESAISAGTGRLVELAISLAGQVQTDPKRFSKIY